MKVPGMSYAFFDVLETFSSPVPVGRSEHRQFTLQWRPLGAWKVYGISIVLAAHSTVHVTVSSPSVARKPTDEGGLPTKLFLDSVVLLVAGCGLRCVNGANVSLFEKNIFIFLIQSGGHNLFQRGTCFREGIFQRCPSIRVC